MRLVAGVGLLVLPGAVHAQQDQGSATPQKSCSVVDENGKTVIWPDCKPPAEDAKPAAPVAPANAGRSDAPAGQRFPFPGEQSAAPSADSASGVDSSSVPTTKRFPFPGEPASDGKQSTAPGGGLQDAGSSGSSESGSSSSSSSSSSDGAGSAEGGGVGPLAGDDDEAAKEAAARKSARHKLPAVARQSPDEREAEDLKVASFYMDDKNFKGAYLRATDAVSVADDDADAHLALAEAARKLGKLDEAMKHYKKSLTLDPVPKTKKAAEKALKEMAGG
jgi:hypothetical protein